MSSYHPKIASTFSEPIWILETARSLHRCSGPYIKWLRKLLALTGPWNSQSLFHISRLLCRLLCPLGQYNSANPMVVGLSTGNRFAVQNFWQVLIGESEKRSLEFWNKTLPSANNYYPFERQLLAHYWALVETEHWQWTTKLSPNFSCPQLGIRWPTKQKSRNFRAAIHYQMDVEYIWLSTNRPWGISRLHEVDQMPDSFYSH